MDGVCGGGGEGKNQSKIIKCEKLKVKREDRQIDNRGQKKNEIRDVGKEVHQQQQQQ